MKTHLTIPLRIKALNKRQFEGHGSVFGNEDLGGDIVVPGAFSRSLAAHRKNGTMPPMFWMHQPDRVLGRWDEMAEDDEGLQVKGTLAKTDLGSEIHELLAMDAVRGLSIGYRTVDSDWTDDGVRVLKELELWEVSVVSLPMNPLARVEHVKSQLSGNGEYVPTRREFEQTLRDVGCSQSVAKRMIAKLYESDDDPGLRDVEGLDEIATLLQTGADSKLIASMRSAKF